MAMTRRAFVEVWMRIRYSFPADLRAQRLQIELTGFLQPFRDGFVSALQKFSFPVQCDAPRSRLCVRKLLDDDRFCRFCVRDLLR